MPMIPCPDCIDGTEECECCGQLTDCSTCGGYQEYDPNDTEEEDEDVFDD